MLSPLWWLPLAVAAAAVAPLWRGARGLLEETARLQASIAELKRVRPLVDQVKADIAGVGVAPRGVHDLGHR